MPEPVQQRSMVDVIRETEIRDVRLVSINGRVDRIPGNVRVDFEASEASVYQGEDEILAKFEHTATFLDEDQVVASIELAHVARFTYNPGLELDEPSVANWVWGNVYFMVYPYVRQSLEDACLRLGLPAVVLGYLKRGQVTPGNMSILVSTTRLAQETAERGPESDSTDDAARDDH